MDFLRSAADRDGNDGLGTFPHLEWTDPGLQSQWQRWADLLVMPSLDGKIFSAHVKVDEWIFFRYDLHLFLMRDRWSDFLFCRRHFWKWFGKCDNWQDCENQIDNFCDFQHVILKDRTEIKLELNWTIASKKKKGEFEINP